MAFDLILEHGTVLDGTGRDGFPASVAIADGRIAAVGDLDYGWSGMGSFLAALERRGLALNVAQLVGHGTVRAAVKGAEPGPATPGEVAAMADLVRGALDEGAIGLSTGLGYAPGVFADLDELLGVTAPLQEHGGVYTSP